MASSTLLVLLSVIVVVSAGHKYRYYYYRPASHETMANRLNKLEKEIDSLERPVHVHIHGNNEDGSAHSNLEGSHLHLHLSLDGQSTTTATFNDEWSYATCKLQPNIARSPLDGVKGFVHFRQKPSTNLEMRLEISGFPRPGLYGFHVHEVADFKNGCNSFGGHFNPYGKVHGGPSDTTRHVGDFGNIQADRLGNISLTMTDRLASIFGPHPIVGRGIVVHAGTDDLGKGGNAGSLKTGNAGPRMACCVIGWAKEEGPL